MNYSYPIDPNWSYDELMAVMGLLEAVELAYEKGVAVSLVAERYNRYHDMGFSKSDEKKLDKDFCQASGYSLHELLKACQKGEKFIRLHK